MAFFLFVKVGGVRGKGRLSSYVERFWNKKLFFCGRLFLYYIKPEAYHLEASKFSLYVGNNAGVFHPTNQSHGIFFAQIWNQRIELSLFK